MSEAGQELMEFWASGHESLSMSPVCFLFAGKRLQPPRLSRILNEYQRFKQLLIKEGTGTRNKGEAVNER